MTSQAAVVRWSSPPPTSDKRAAKIASGQSVAMKELLAENDAAQSAGDTTHTLLFGGGPRPHLRDTDPPSPGLHVFCPMQLLIPVTLCPAAC